MRKIGHSHNLHVSVILAPVGRIKSRQCRLNRGRDQRWLWSPGQRQVITDARDKLNGPFPLKRCRLQSRKKRHAEAYLCIGLFVLHLLHTILLYIVSVLCILLSCLQSLQSLCHDFAVMLTVGKRALHLLQPLLKGLGIGVTVIQTK